VTSFLRSSKDAAATDEDNEAIDSMWHHREGIQIFDSTPYKTISGKFFKSRNFGAQSAPVDVASYVSPYSKTPESSREGFQLLHPTRELRRHSKKSRKSDMRTNSEKMMNSGKIGESEKDKKNKKGNKGEEEEIGPGGEDLRTQSTLPTQSPLAEDSRPTPIQPDGVIPPVLGPPPSSSKRKDELGDRQRKKKKSRHSMHTTSQPFEAEDKSAFNAWFNKFKEESVVTTNDKRDHGNGQ
jgi:hypothetical protein